MAAVWPAHTQQTKKQEELCRQPSAALKLHGQRSEPQRIACGAQQQSGAEAWRRRTAGGGGVQLLDRFLGAAPKHGDAGLQVRLVEACRGRRQQARGQAAAPSERESRRRDRRPVGTSRCGRVPKTATPRARTRHDGAAPDLPGLKVSGDQALPGRERRGGQVGKDGAARRAAAAASAGDGGGCSQRRRCSRQPGASAAGRRGGCPSSPCRLLALPMIGSRISASTPCGHGGQEGDGQAAGWARQKERCWSAPQAHRRGASQRTAGTLPPLPPAVSWLV